MIDLVPLDTLGMFAATASMPEQIPAGVEAATEIAAASRIAGPAAITSVLVLGMGGSGLVGDFLAVTAGPFMSLPVVVVKNYEPPSYVDNRTLVFAVSFSGETEETLSAASIAAERGGQMVAVSTGGRLASMAKSWGGPVACGGPRHPDAADRVRRHGSAGAGDAGGPRLLPRRQRVAGQGCNPVAAPP